MLEINLSFGLKDNETDHAYVAYKAVLVQTKAVASAF